MSRPTRCLNVVLATGALALSACSSTLTLDATTLNDALDHADEDVPFCVSPSNDTAARVAYGADTPVAQDGPGACGGSVTVTSDHANGTTDYVLTFDRFCSSSADGDVFLDGVLVAREEGTPSDFGPVIDAFELSSDGLLEVEHPNGSTWVNLDKARSEYGVPSEWGPGAPTTDNPDLVDVRSLELSYPDGRVDYAHDLRIERTDVNPAVITVLDGRVGTEGEGYVNVRTVEGDPLVVNLNQLQVSGGTLEFTGSGGSMATVQQDPAKLGQMLITLEGAPFDRTLDCSAGVGPIAQMGLAVVFELPIY